MPSLLLYTYLMHVTVSVVIGQLIMSRYIAESITLIPGHFGHVGLCQLRTKLQKLQCETCHIANTGQWCCVMKVRK